MNINQHHDLVGTYCTLSWPTVPHIDLLIYLILNFCTLYWPTVPWLDLLYLIMAYCILPWHYVAYIDLMYLILTYCTSRWSIAPYAYWPTVPYLDLLYLILTYGTLSWPTVPYIGLLYLILTYYCTLSWGRSSTTLRFIGTASRGSSVAIPPSTHTTKVPSLRPSPLSCQKQTSGRRYKWLGMRTVESFIRGTMYNIGAIFSSIQIRLVASSMPTGDIGLYCRWIVCLYY